MPCHRCARIDTRPDTATHEQSGPGPGAHGTAHTRAHAHVCGRPGGHRAGLAAWQPVCRHRPGSRRPSVQLESRGASGGAGRGGAGRDSRGQGVVGLGQDLAGGFKEGTVDSPRNGEQRLLPRWPLSIKPHFSVHKNAPPPQPLPILAERNSSEGCFCAGWPGHMARGPVPWGGCTLSEKGGPGGNEAWHTPRMS